jgi:PPM family protein phosphatase
MAVGRWGACSDRGPVRSVNEDAFLADPPLFLVADGMGGHSAGDVASGLAIANFVALAGGGSIRAQQVIEALSASNQAILDAANFNPNNAGMGTTIAGLAVVVAGGIDHWMVFSVGDSRVYRLALGHLEQLTVDHSEAEEMILAGRMTREEARTYHRRNIVTRSLGTNPAPVPDSLIFPQTDGDRFVICSDGLTTEVADEAIEACLLSNPDPQRAAEELVHLALAARGGDNVTVIVVDGSAAGPIALVDEDTSPPAV